MNTFLGCSERNSLSDIIKKEDGKVSVDWKKFFDVEKSRDERGYETLIRMLKKENVLSLSEENTYAVLAGGIDGSPLSGGLLRWYFPKKEDAIAYAEAKYGRAVYDVSIVQFAGRIKKKK